MLNSALYRRGAIKKHVPYKLVLRYYWKNLIGTCGAWFLYGAVIPPSMDCVVPALAENADDPLSQILSRFQMVSSPALSFRMWWARAPFARQPSGSCS